MAKTNGKCIRRFNIAFRAVNQRGYTRGIQVLIEAVNAQQATHQASEQMKKDGYQELRVVRVIDMH
ncbi:hypothetical protein [Serratia marcescens]|uniref:hypothetical protein n=1 Tax=Serratia marcescens TaxID=615 RepID=UPI0013DD78FA|nr:hypothetical protein [Serratia marcescens]